MAPKKKDKELKRRNIVCVKLTDIELANLDDSADKANVSRSDYIRNLLRNKKMTLKYQIVIDSQEIQPLLAAYGKIGSNLNQIAKYFNSGGERSLAMEDEIRQCISELYSLRSEVLTLTGKYNGNSKTHKKP